MTIFERFSGGAKTNKKEVIVPIDGVVREETPVVESAGNEIVVPAISAAAKIEKEQGREAKVASYKAKILERLPTSAEVKDGLLATAKSARETMGAAAEKAPTKDDISRFAGNALETAKVGAERVRQGTKETADNIVETSNEAATRVKKHCDDLGIENIGLREIGGALYASKLNIWGALVIIALNRSIDVAKLGSKIAKEEYGIDIAPEDFPKAYEKYKELREDENIKKIIKRGKPLVTKFGSKLAKRLISKKK